MRANEASGVTHAAIETDVLIIGGGFVGLTLACGLADSAITSVVVETGDPRRALARSFDGRASAIALTSRRLLHSIGIWSKLAGEAAPMLDIRVSEGLRGCSCTTIIARLATSRSGTCWKTRRCAAPS